MGVAVLFAGDLRRRDLVQQLDRAVRDGGRLEVDVATRRSSVLDVAASSVGDVAMPVGRPVEPQRLLDAVEAGPVPRRGRHPPARRSRGRGRRRSPRSVRSLVGDPRSRVDGPWPNHVARFHHSDEGRWVAVYERGPRVSPSTYERYCSTAASRPRGSASSLCRAGDDQLALLSLVCWGSTSRTCRASGSRGELAREPGREVLVLTEHSVPRSSTSNSLTD